MTRGIAFPCFLLDAGDEAHGEEGVARRGRRSFWWMPILSIWRRSCQMVASIFFGVRLGERDFCGGCDLLLVGCG